MIVVQGDMPDPRACPVRDAYEIYDIPPRPAGATRLKVTFQYNASGVIEVEAEDVLSGQLLPQRKKPGDIDWDSLIAPDPVPVVRPMDIALVIDCSESMRGDKMRAAQEAAIRFLDAIDPNVHRVGLVIFHYIPELLSKLTRDFTKLRRKIEYQPAGGGNSDEKAIAVARDLVLLNRVKQNKHEKVLVLLVDGLPHSEAEMIQEAKQAKQQGVRIIVILVWELHTKIFGFEVKDDPIEIKNEKFGFLNEVASTPEDYYFVGESVQLASTFTTIANRLVAESSSGGSGLTMPTGSVDPWDLDLFERDNPEPWLEMREALIETRVAAGLEAGLEPRKARKKAKKEARKAEKEAREKILAKEGRIDYIDGRYYFNVPSGKPGDGVPDRGA